MVPKLIDVCYKIGNYDNLHYHLETIAKTSNVDVKFVYSLFYERNPSYPTVKSIKEMIEDNRAHLKKGDITIDDVDTVLQNKEEIIKGLNNRISSYDIMVKNQNSLLYQYEQTITNMKMELQRKNFQLAAYNKDVVFRPTSPSSFDFSFPALPSRSPSSPPGLSPVSPTMTTGNPVMDCFKPIEKLEHSMLDIFKRDIWKDTKSSS